MPALQAIEQKDFSKGMILGVRQDAPFENQQWDSAAWVENLNPNEVLGELNTREGQQQSVIDTFPVEDVYTGNIISALEMTHTESTNSEKSVLHVMSDTVPTIRTSELDYGGYQDGVWSGSGSPFQYPPSDYDVYGESVLLTSNSPSGTITASDRKPVYAYTYKDYEQFLGQKNELGQDLFLYGITKTIPPIKRWEILNEADLAAIIEPLFETEDVPPEEVAKYLTAEAPMVNGNIIKITGGQIASEVQPGAIYDIEPVSTSYKIKVGANAVTVTAYGWNYYQIDETQRQDPSFIAGAGLGYHPIDRVLQQLVPVWGAINRADFVESPTYLYDPDPDYMTLPQSQLFPILWEVIDYVDTEKPRNFYVGERIPYVITAVVNGIEKIIKKDTYIVHGTDDEIDIGIVSYFQVFDITIPPDGLNPGETKLEAAHNDFLPQRGASKRVHFNIRLNVLDAKEIPLGLSEVRLYIANKNVADRGMWNHVYPNLPSVSEVTAPDDYKGWVTLPDSLYLNPDSDRESFSYSLAKSFVVFGDPDLYKRRTVDTDHSNYGVNNVKVNEWEFDGTGFIGKKMDGLTVRSEFYIWDYMNRTGEPLATNLGSALVLWKGKGASVIASIKGATFIGGCLDSIGKLEVGLIRKSLLQGAVQSTDTFAEVDYIKVGNETHTALIEFRGQLWAFSRTQTHRIQMRDMSDLDTVEVLEVLESNGTFSPKTVIASPYGVAWLNESGCWLSNGGEPTLLSKEIEPLYLHIVKGKLWQGSNGDQIQFQTPLAGKTWNTTMQIVYDPLEYNIVISSQAERQPHLVVTEGAAKPLDFRLLYSVTYKNWRIETYPLALTFNDTSFGDVHRTHFARTKYKSLGLNPPEFRVHETNEDNQKDFPLEFGGLAIQNRLTLHELGNGTDDYQLNSINVEAALDTDILTIPKLYLHTRDNTSPFVGAGAQGITDPLHKGDVASYAVSGVLDPYWLQNKIDTPIEANTSLTAEPKALKQTFVMTSQHHRVPFMKPVRRTVLEYVASGVIRLRSFRIMVNTFTRKFFG